ncbi:hypothetical protein MKX03_019286 [Papaver bracteatum]|nr:hypothetical protein MKX03_019286 [Papaver bracteatum]
MNLRYHRKRENKFIVRLTATTTNSEMSCTLPYSNVDSNLRALAGQAEGFGKCAIEGLHGPIYHVIMLANDEFTGKGLKLKEYECVIICNLEFEGGRGHDVDCTQIKHKPKHIWFDRCSLSDFDDGCHFYKHDKTMLIRVDPTHVTDRCIRVTNHHCFFDGTVKENGRNCETLYWKNLPKYVNSKQRTKLLFIKILLISNCNSQESLQHLYPQFTLRKKNTCHLICSVYWQHILLHCYNIMNTL